MIRTERALILIAAGLAMLLLGFGLLLAMAIRLIAPGLALSFLSYAACGIGLILGLIGIMVRVK